MNSLDAAKNILAIARTLWGTSYIMDVSGAIWPVSGNGPDFISLSEAIKAMQDHISRKHAADLLTAISSDVSPCDNCELSDGCIVQPFTDECDYLREGENANDKVLSL